MRFDFRKYLNLLSFTFCLLFILTLPFPLQFIQHPAFLFETFFSTIEQNLCVLLGFSFHFQGHFYSDSIDLLVHVCFIFLLALIVSITLFKWSLFQTEKIKQLSLLIPAYILAFFMIKYGFDKVFKLQFYYPEPNILYTELGRLDLDILYWSTIGKSYSYSVFMGLMEIIPGILLLYSKTRKLGAFICFGLLLHVLMINISYNIEVKFLSSFLLLLSVLILAHYWKAIFAFFIRNEAYLPEQEMTIIKHLKLKRLIKFTLVFYIFFESTFLAFSTGNFNGDSYSKNKFHGTYQIDNQSNELNKLIQQKDQIKRLFIHSKNYLIFETENEKMIDFPIQSLGDAYFFEFQKQHIGVHFEQEKSPVKFQIHFYTTNDTLQIQATRLD